MVCVSKTDGVYGIPPIFFLIFKLDVLFGEEVDDPSTGINALG
jgi:hypothetical protein